MRGHMVALLAVALAAVIGYWGGESTRTAEAEVNISGTWNLQFSGDLSFSCAAPIAQVGSSVSIDLAGCVAGKATGTINTATGAFSANWNLPPGPAIGLNGTATGTSMSGTWLAFTPPSNSFTGTFTGTLKGATPTLTPTPTPTPTATSLSVGGIAELPDVNATRQTTPDSSGLNSLGLMIGIAVASSLALGGVAWHARRRRVK